MKSKLRLTYERMIAYFSNKLTEKERHAFEKSVMQDEFESDAYDGLSKLSSLELKQDLEELNLGLVNKIKSKQRKRLLWLPYAASIVVILGLSFVLYYINQTPSVNEFVSQDIEKSQPKIKVEQPPVSFADTIKKVEAKKKEYTEKLNVVADEEKVQEEESEIISFAEDEDAAFAEEVRDVEIQENLPIVKTLEAKDEQLSELTNAKVKKALSGKVAGVSVNKVDTGIRIIDVEPNTTYKKTRQIKGQVVDGNQEPIPGVSIVVKGTNHGVTTDIDGKFTMKLDDPKSDYKLTASFVGFETKELDASDSLLVVLEEDKVGMDEVVVTAFAAEKESHATGSVSVVEMDKPIKSWNNARPSQSKNISAYKEKLISALQSEFRNKLKGKYKLKVSFTVHSYGTISDIRIKGDKNQALYEKITQFIQNSEEWIPAIKDNSSVDSKVRLKLRIDLN